MLGAGLGSFSLIQLSSPLNNNLTSTVDPGQNTGLHPDTVNWKNRVLAKGGIIDDDIDLPALDIFVRGCYDAGLRDRNGQNHILVELLPFAGNNLAAVLTKLWYHSSAATLANVNFVESDYSKSTGLQGDGYNKCLFSRLILANAGLQNSTSIGIYNRTNGGTEGIEIGAEVGTDYTSRLVLHAQYLDNNCYFDCFDSYSNSGRTSTPLTSSAGLLVCSRLYGVGSTVYHNGVLSASTQSFGGQIPDRELFYFANNATDNFYPYSSRALGLIFVGKSIPPNLQSTFNDLVVNLMMAFGRAV